MSAAASTTASVAPARTGLANQIPRNALALLMVGQLAVLLPHLAHQTPWLMAVALFCGIWRTQVHRGRWSYPSRRIKALLVLLALVGVVVSSRSGVSLESATALLLVAFALKLLEMKHRRDAYLVIFLCYFVIATAFLFSQTLLLATYQLLATVVVTAALIGLNQVHSEVRFGLSLRTAAVLIAQALPLTLVLFVFFPRIAPLWSMPLPDGARTGISERMKPGDVAQLSRSDELAFRVAFEERLPRQSELYFRALVYSRFAEGTWSVHPQAAAYTRSRRNTLPAEVATLAPGPRALRYEVFLEATAQDWVVALDTPLRGDADLKRNGFLGLEVETPVLSLKRYGLLSDPDVRLQGAGLPDWLRNEETRLPAGESERLRAYSRERYAALGRDPQRFMDWILGEIREQPFRYTLSPPTLPDADSIDAFWFGSRAGFCTHYAGAMVFMLRSVDIPARMVGGYQGGSINPITRHLEVRQYDAHAWVEAWLPEVGWLRLDPTAAVAPQRVEQGLSAALSASERGALSLFANARLGQEGLLASVLQFADSLEHRWNLWVVGFDEGQQQGVLRGLLGELSPARIGIAMLIGGAISLALVSALLFWRQRPRRRDPLLKAFDRFCDVGAGQGAQRRPEESPAHYVARIGARMGLPDGELADLVGALTAALYNPQQHSAHRATAIAQLRRLALRARFAGRLDAQRA
ncbi:MAG: transglutaminaseTgpA domain-containing protein [Pseudomonadota bacterium]